MEEQISQKATGLYSSAKPWRAGMAWWLIAAEGAAALMAGIYLLVADDAAKNVQFIIALVLIGFGLMQIYTAVRSSGSSDPFSQFRLISGTVGVIGGLLVMIDRFSDYLSLDATRIVLGVCFALIGILSFWGMLKYRESRNDRLAMYVVNGVFVAFGIMLLYNVTTDRNLNDTLGWILVVIGVAFLALAIYRKAQEDKSKTTAAATSVEEKGKTTAAATSVEEKS